VTDLDRVGIPNFMAVRPHDRGPGISYYNGKGTTRADAYAGAMMEAIDRHAGERYDDKLKRGLTAFPRSLVARIRRSTDLTSAQRCGASA
jgi:YcaO-like protein with predicted kinase domain